MLLGKVKRGVGQLQRAVVAVFSVGVGDTLQHRQGTNSQRRERQDEKDELEALQLEWVLQAYLALR